MRVISVAWATLLGSVLVGLAASPSAAWDAWANPSTKGWTIVPGDQGKSGRAPFDSEFFDVRVWEIDEPGSETLRYAQDGSLAPAANQSWTFDFWLRVVDLDVPASAGIQLVVANGASLFELDLGSDAQGGTVIELVGTGNSVVIAPRSAPGVQTDYIKGALVYSVGTGTADLVVNDVQVASDWVGAPSALRRVSFGDGSAEPGGRVRFLQISWSSQARIAACRDGFDNDRDGLIDFSGGDPDCSAENDWNEGTAPDCSDFDGDLVCDSIDNCQLFENGPNQGGLDQLDANLDGYGNRCDADFNNDGAINGGDWGALTCCFSSPNRTVDLTGDGIVNGADFNAFISLFNTAPGPSGLACAGTIPCTP